MTVCFKGKTNCVAVLFIFSVFYFTSCRKDNTNTIGADFIGKRINTEILFRNDPSDLILFSARQDSVPTRSFYFYSLGDMNDPDIGKTKSNIFTQFSVPFSGFSFNGGIIDSVVLQLKYVSNVSYYGNLQTTQEISVYELKEPLSGAVDSGYFSNRNYLITDIGISASPIGFFSGRFNLNDSVNETVNGVINTYEPHLRIKLGNAFISKLQKAEAAGAFQSDATLQSYIYGLAIMAQTPDGSLPKGDGALAYFNLRHTISGVNVYYHNSAVNQKINFPMPTSDVATNQFAHTFHPGVGIRSNFDSSNRANVCYVQSNAGIKTRVLLPNIFNFAANNQIVIMGAELIFTVQDGTDNDPVYHLPASLRLHSSDSLGRNIFIEDIFEPYPLNYYGGTYDAATHTYRFNIIRHIQKLLNTYKLTGLKTDYGMNLTFFDNDFYNGIGSGRVIINANKAALHLSYSVIK